MSWYIDKQVIRTNDKVSNDILSRFRSEPKGSGIGKVFKDYNYVNNETIVLRCANTEELLQPIRPTKILTVKDLRKKYGVDLEITCGFKPANHQKKPIKFLLDKFNHLKVNDLPRILLDLTTGFGKGYITNYCITQLKLRPLILIKPTYVDKWIEELTFHYGITSEDILLVNTRKRFNELDFNGERIVIITTTLITNMMKEKGGELALTKLMEKVKSSVLVNDETHQHFDSVMNAVRLLNPHILIGMSASLVTNDSTEKRRQKCLFDDDVRMSFKANEPHIHYNMLAYTIAGLDSHHYEIYNVGYNHNLYEKTILSCDVTKSRWMNLISSRLKRMYLDNPNRKKGDKALIFASSIDMIDAIVLDLKTRVSNSDKYKNFKITRYTGDEDYDIINKNEIIVATVGKAGTAIDIKGLMYAMNTVNIGSFQLNVQIPGRLRIREGYELQFDLLFNRRIIKHSNYIRQYMREFKHLYKTTSSIDSGFSFEIVNAPKKTFGKKKSWGGKNKWNGKRNKTPIRKYGGGQKQIHGFAKDKKKNYFGTSNKYGGFGNRMNKYN